MFKYLLFAGDYYYPSGGIRDYKGSFEICEDAEIAAKAAYKYSDGSGEAFNDWWHIVDRDTMKIIKES